MTGGFQPSLLDTAREAGLRELAASMRRTELAHGAWADLLPGWVIGADALFERLLETVPWRAERRQMYDNVVAVPRLLSFYAADEALPDPVLEQARHALDGYYGPNTPYPRPPARRDRGSASSSGRATSASGPAASGSMQAACVSRRRGTA